jgi:hypothetical protein
LVFVVVVVANLLVWKLHFRYLELKYEASHKSLNLTFSRFSGWKLLFIIDQAINKGNFYQMGFNAFSLESVRMSQIQFLWNKDEIRIECC